MAFTWGGSARAGANKEYDGRQHHWQATIELADIVQTYRVKGKAKRLFHEYD
jgi:hypothetical protein